MSRTITALFDQRSDAEAAKERLKQARVDAGHIHLHDKTSAGYKDAGYSTHEDRGFWDSIKNAFAPDEDRHAYEEGVRRGGTLLTADVDEDQIDEAVRVLEDSNSIDLDDRSQQWRSSGWDYAPGAAAGAMGAGYAGRERDMGTDTKAGTTDEEVIPIVEENLVVGKREVDRGGARVRSYVSEVPVHEQIRLRDEKVEVTRRKVDQPLSEADGDAFRERTIDMAATGEEAVVGKTARVVEEVVVSKTADSHVEQIDDTVRRTEVEVDRDTAAETAKDRDPRR